MTREKCAWKGMLAGAVGGLAASYVMNQFQAGWMAANERLLPESQRRRLRPKKEKDENAPATIKAAEAIWRVVGGGKLSEHQKKIAGPIIHYAFGAANGAMYGALSKYMPRTRVGRGTVFGAVLWVVADEVGVPALGLSKSPENYPLSNHLYALASHLVYGVTADGVSRGVRALL